MVSFSEVVYALFLKLYYLSALAISPFNPKARKWIEGRKGVVEELKKKSDKRKVIWMHCASLGEYEQGRPVLDELKEKHQDYRIVVTFFSPSGYEAIKDKNFAEVFYLPHDSAKSSREFLNALHPEIAIFVKYEFWYYYLAELKKRETIAIHISAFFRKEDIFFKWYGSFFREMLGCFSQIFVQNEKSAELLNHIAINNVTVSGDTRFDRVLKIKQENRQFEWIRRFSEKSEVLIAGSTWHEDEQLLITLAKERLGIRFVIAPHNIEPGRMRDLKNKIPNAIYYSEIGQYNASDINTLIIDNTGMLSQLYKYGVIAYVGGGFNKGIHNILEAAANGIPVIIGPNYSRFNEAVELVQKRGAFEIGDFTQLKSKVLELLNQKDEYETAAKVCADYVHSRQGATATIVSYLEKYLSR